MKRKKSLEPLFAVLSAALVACGMGAGRDAPRASNAQTPVPTAASLNVTIAGMIDLGLADVRDINSAGEIVGAIKVGGYSHAALVVGGKVYDLGTIDDSGTTPASSSGSAINGVGQVVGHGVVGTEEYNFVWSPNVPNGTTGRMRRLPPSPDGLVAYALNINDAGQVVGHTDASSLLWTGDQVVQLINFSAFGDREVINNFGQVAGIAWNYTAEGYDWRAFLWTPDVPNGTTGTLVDLIGPNSSAYGINDRGQVVGSWPAFVWSPSSPNTSSGTLVMLDGMEQCLDINNQGQIAGALLSGYGGSHAALWTPDEPNGATGTVTDLGPPGALSPIGQARALSAESNGEIRIIGVVQGNGAVYELGPSFLWTVTTHSTPPSQGPVARPKATTGSEGSAAAFDGTMSTGNPQPLMFSWSFGDGTIGSGRLRPTRTRIAARTRWPWWSRTRTESRVPPLPPPSRFTTWRPLGR